MVSLRLLAGSNAPPQKPLARWSPHTALVHGVAVLSDGDSLVSSSEDGSLLVSSLSRQTKIRALKGHRGPVNSLCLTPDGEHLVTGSDDSTIRVWSTADWACKHVLKGHKGSYVREVDATSEIIVSGAEDEQVRFWDLRTGKCRSVGKDHSEHLRTVAISRDGRRAASVGLENALLVWDVGSGKKERALYDGEGDVHHLSNTGGLYISSPNQSGVGHPDAPRRLCFLERGRVLVSIEREVIFWDVETGAEIRRWPAQGWPYSAFALHPERPLIALVYRGVQLWDLNEGRELAMLDRGGEFLESVCFTPDGRKLITGDRNGQLSVWDVEEALSQRDGATHGDSVNHLVVGGDRALTRGTDGSVALWALDEARLVARLPAEMEANGVAIALSPSGKTAVTGRKEGLDIWDAERGAHKHRYDTSSLESALWPHGFGFVGDRAVVVGFIGDGLAVCDAGEPWERRDLKGKTKQVSQVLVDPAGAFAVTAGYFPRGNRGHNGVEQLQGWSLEEGRVAWTKPSKKAKDSYVGFVFYLMRSDGRVVTRSGDREDEIVVLDPADGRVETSVRFDGDWVPAARLLDDTTLIAAVSSTSRSKVELLRIDLEAGEIREQLSLLVFKSARSICIAPHGRWVAATDDEAVVLIDGHTGEELGRYEAGSEVQECGCSPDGRRIIAGDDAGRVHILAVEGDAPAPARSKKTRGERSRAAGTAKKSSSRSRR